MDLSRKKSYYRSKSTKSSSCTRIPGRPVRPVRPTTWSRPARPLSSTGQTGLFDQCQFWSSTTVDSDTTNLKDLVDDIRDQYPPGYLEVAHVQYYDADLKTFPVVNTDQELMSCFRNIVTTKVVHMFIAYSDLFYIFVYSHLNTFTSNYISFFPS